MSKTAEEIKQDKEAKAVEEAITALSNKDMRAGVRYFDTAQSELGQGDFLVMAAHKKDPSRSLEDYDDMSMVDLVKVLTGE